MKLILYKEKYSKWLNIIYILVLGIYTLLLVMSNDDRDFVMVMFFLVWFSFMIEIFRHSLFHLHSFYAKDVNINYNQPVTSRLMDHLKVLSIKGTSFIKLNLIYTGLRLLPFLIIGLIFGESKEFQVFLLVFVSVYIVKSVFGPLYTHIMTYKYDVVAENSDYSKSEIKEEVTERIQEDYQYFDYRVIQYGVKLFLISYLLICFYVFQFIFLYSPLSFDYRSPFSVSCFVLGITILTGFSVTLYVFERIKEHELYQE